MRSTSSTVSSSGLKRERSGIRLGMFHGTFLERDARVARVVAVDEGESGELGFSELQIGVMQNVERTVVEAGQVLEPDPRGRRAVARDAAVREGHPRPVHGMLVTAELERAEPREPCELRDPGVRGETGGALLERGLKAVE